MNEPKKKNEKRKIKAKVKTKNFLYEYYLQRQQVHNAQTSFSPSLGLTIIRNVLFKCQMSQSDSKCQYKNREKVEDITQKYQLTRETGNELTDQTLMSK